MLRILAAAALTLLAPPCSRGDAGAAEGAGTAKRVTLTIAGPKGSHEFRVEVAATADAQERGLMFRTDIPKDGGMLFAPYPPDGGPPKPAILWMKNTPSPLDILFIRPDRREHGAFLRNADPLGRGGRRGAGDQRRPRQRTGHRRRRQGDVGKRAGREQGRLKRAGFEGKRGAWASI